MQKIISELKSYHKLDLLGYFALYWLCIGAFFGEEGYKISFIILICLFIYKWERTYNIIKNTNLLWLIVGLNSYLLLRTAISMSLEPSMWKLHFELYWEVFVIAGIPALIISYWLINHKNINHKKYALLALGTGFIVDLSRRLNWNNLTDQLNSRPDLGTHCNTFAILSAIFLWGALTIGTMQITQSMNNKKNNKYIFFYIIVWLSCIFIGTSGVIIAQSRSVWFALVFVLLATFLLITINYKRYKIHFKPTCLIVILMLMPMLLASINLSETVSNRIAQNDEMYVELLNFNWSNIEFNSMGKRIYMWQNAIENIKEKPIFGWGPGSPENLLNSYKKNFAQKFTTVHNIYIDLMLRFGILGILLLIILNVNYFLYMNKAMKFNQINKDIYVFWIGAMALVLISGLGDWRFQFQEFRTICIFLGSIPISSKIDLLLNKSI